MKPKILIIEPHGDDAWLSLGIFLKDNKINSRYDIDLLTVSADRNKRALLDRGYINKKYSLNFTDAVENGIENYPIEFKSLKYYSDLYRDNYIKPRLEAFKKSEYLNQYSCLENFFNQVSSDWKNYMNSDLYLYKDRLETYFDYFFEDINSFAYEKIFVPVGLYHTTHMLVHSVCMGITEIASSIVLYSDIPYSGMSFELKVYEDFKVKSYGYKDKISIDTYEDNQEVINKLKEFVTMYPTESFLLKEHNLYKKCVDDVFSRKETLYNINKLM